MKSLLILSTLLLSNLSYATSNEADDNIIRAVKQAINEQAAELECETTINNTDWGNTTQAAYAGNILNFIQEKGNQRRTFIDTQTSPEITLYNYADVGEHAYSVEVTTMNDFRDIRSITTSYYQVIDTHTNEGTLLDTKFIEKPVRKVNYQVVCKVEFN